MAPKDVETSGATSTTIPKGSSKVEHDPALKNETCFHFPDCLFMLAWFVSVAVMFYLAIEMGVVEVQDQYDSYTNQQSKDDLAYSLIDDKISDTIVGVKNMSKIIAYMMLFAVLMSFIWTFVLIVFGEILIHFLFFMAMALLSGLGFVCCFTIDNDAAYWLGIGMFVLAGLTFVYWCCIRSRIAFAAETLAVGANIVKHDYMLFILAFVMAGVTGAYTIVFALAEFGIYYGYEDSNDDIDDDTKMATMMAIVWFVVMLMFFWTIQVLSNIMVVTVSGCASEWWFGSEGSVPVMRAFCRAITFDLGAICFGSLLVALIQTMYSILVYLAEKAKKSGNSLLACIIYCLACCVACFEKCAEYMNKYAYTFVGIYGYGFMTAGTKVMSLFVNEGLTILQNDLIVEYLLFFSNCIVGVLTSGVGVVLVQNSPARWTMGLHPYAQAIAGVMGFIIGYCVSSVMTGIIDASNKAVFILFLENPHALEVTHEIHHTRLAARWKAIGHTERESDVAADM